MNRIMRSQRFGVGLGGGLAIGAVLLAACSSDPVKVDPVASVQKTGLTDNQQVAAGTEVPRSPEVTLTLASGELAEGETVVFAVKSGGGSILGGVATTDIRGKAVVQSWTLGPTAGPNTLSATANGIEVMFTAIGIPGPASQVVISAGQEQTARINSEVPVRPEVKVTDQFGNGVQGVTVLWSVDPGNGSIIGDPSIISEPDGLARIGGWVLGRTPGPQVLTASATGFSAVTFNATATP